jgi:hypothetical protein
MTTPIQTLLAAGTIALIAVLSGCGGQPFEAPAPDAGAYVVPPQTPAEICAARPTLPECQQGTGRPMLALLEGAPGDVGSICRFQGADTLACGAGEACAPRDNSNGQHPYDTCCVPAGTLFPSNWPRGGFSDSIDGVAICCPGLTLGASDVPGFDRCD